MTIENYAVHSSVDLRNRAERAARDAGFETQFSPQALAEAQQATPAPIEDGIRDLCGLLWSSIDNEESRDLDQVEWCEHANNDAIRVCVGIADVASTVDLPSAINQHAAHNTVSIYTGVETFPMLPERLSNDITSLLPEQKRLALVTEMTIGVDGEIMDSTIYRALLENKAKLVYESIGAWLDEDANKGISPPPEVAQIHGLEAQLRLQWEAARRLKKQREKQGALDVELPEARPVVKEGRVTGLEVVHKNPARLIIENFMVSANMVLAQYLETKNKPAIQRVVREPDRWPRIVQLAQERGAILPNTPNPRALADFMTAQRLSDPENFSDLSLSVLKLLGRGEYAVVRSEKEEIGHFGLGMQRYTHSTAPNRRFPDLVAQRIVQASLSGAPSPYSVDELEAIAAHCSEREAAAQKVERLMRKVAAAAFLQNRIGEVFEAVVTGASHKGIFVRVSSPPVEGRVMHGERGLDVGDKIRVRLLRAEMERGFIDFARA